MKIVSKKMWIEASRDEIEDFLREKLGTSTDFTLMNVRAKGGSSSQAENVEFEIKLSGDFTDG